RLAGRRKARRMSRDPGRRAASRRRALTPPEDLTVRRFLAAPAALLLVSGFLAVTAADPVPEDTPKAAATRKKLKEKVSLNWKDTAFRDVVQDMKDEFKVSIIADTKSGVTLNKQITYSCKDKPAEEALDELLGKTGWGWYVKSQKNDAYDGVVYIK